MVVRVFAADHHAREGLVAVNRGKGREIVEKGKSGPHALGLRDRLDLWCKYLDKLSFIYLLYIN